MQGKIFTVIVGIFSGSIALASENCSLNGVQFLNVNSAQAGEIVKAGGECSKIDGEMIVRFYPEVASGSSCEIVWDAQNNTAMNFEIFGFEVSAYDVNGYLVDDGSPNIRSLRPGITKLDEVFFYGVRCSEISLIKLSWHESISTVDDGYLQEADAIQILNDLSSIIQINWGPSFNLELLGELKN